MALITRSQSLASPPELKTETIDVPEFGEGMQICLRELNGEERWAVIKVIQEDKTDGPNPDAFIITRAAVDENGELVYNVQDSDSIAKWPGKLIDRLSAVVIRMSGLRPDGQDDSGKESKSSGETVSVSSPTESPETSDAPSPS